MRIKQLLSDFAVYGLAPIFPKVAAFFVLPIITPYLTSSDFGIFGIIMAYSVFLELFFTLGLQVNLSNSFFKSPKQYKWLWRQIYGFWVHWAILFGLIKSALLWYIIPTEASDNAILIIILNVVPIVLFGPTSMMASLYYQFKKKPFQVGIRSAMFGVLNMLLTLYFIRYGGMGYMGWFWANFITLTLSNISWWIPFNFIEGMTPIHNYKWKTILKALKVALPILPHQNGLYLLSKSDRVVMDLVGVSTSNIGLYNVSNNVATPMHMIEQAYTKAIQPYIQELIRNKEFIKLKYLFTYSQLIFFCLILAYSSIAKEFIEFLIRNDELNDIYRLSVLIVMITMFRPMYMASNSILFYYEKTKSVGYFTIIAGFTTVCLNILLIPTLGFEIAALNSIVGFIILAYSRFWTNDFKSINIINYNPLMWLGLSTMVIIFGFNLSSAHLPYRLIVLMLSILTILLILFKFSRIVKSK